MASSRKIPSAVVGLDIGSDSIKVVEAKYGKDGISITGLGVAPTPPGTVEDEVIVDPKGLGLAIKTLLAESGIKTKTCVSAVSGQSHVVVRVIEVPKMSKAELAETMKWEVERHVPFSPTQVVMDFQPLEKPDPDPNAQNMEVLLAVAQDTLVNSHVEALLAAGLKPVAIDIEPLAVSRSLIEAARNGLKEQVIGIVNIGNKNTDLGVFEDGVLTFPSPPLATSGATLTEEIAQALNETPEKAETLKREYASVNLAGFAASASAAGTAFTVQEPTSMGADDQGQDAGGGLTVVPGGSPDEAAQLGETPTEVAPEFHVTVDGPVFGEAEPAEEPSGPKFDLGDDGVSAAQLASEKKEVAGGSDAGPTFDLGAIEPQADETFKPDFDLEDEAEPARPVIDLGDTGVVPGQPAAVQPAYQPGSIVDRVFEAISGPLVDLANDIRRSLDYYATRYSKMPEKIFLCGGTAKIPHLDEFLTNELGVKVEVGDPVSNLNVKVTNVSDRYLREISPLLAVSIGLAIRDMVG